MSDTKDFDILIHIVRHCEQIFQTQNRFGDDYEAFSSDNDYYDSVAMKIFQIGELANHLSSEFKLTYPDIPWQKIKGMRNIVAHQYDQLDLEVVWVTIKERIPELFKYCESIVNHNKLL